jgi:hypothetical protein
MNLVLAGSFPHLYNVEKEKKLKALIEKGGYPYNRLASFYYPKTCDTLLKIKGEEMGIEPVMSEPKEKKRGRFDMDFEKAKKASLEASEALKKKFDWILDFRWAGDITFKPGRLKSGVKEQADKGEEVSFGLNMIMTYLDEKKKKKETQIVIRHKAKPFYEYTFKSYVPKPTKEDLVKQMEKIWILLESGGTPAKPKAVILTRLGEYPFECIKNAEGKKKGHAGQFRIAFAKWAKYTLCDSVDIFGEDPIEALFLKIRKG